MTVKEMLTSGLFGVGKKSLKVVPLAKPAEVAPVASIPPKRPRIVEPVGDLDQDYIGSISMGPVKKMPRFQRTIITDKQKDALLFVFLHEHRPTTKTIDQIAAALGLSSRTVTNWFHNFRTRQKAKELKLISEGLELPKLPSISGMTESLEGEVWFREIVEILSRNKGLETFDGSGFMDEPLPTMITDSDARSSTLTVGDADSSPYDGSSPTSSSSKSTEGRAPSRRTATKESAGVGGKSQLDKVIARMHNKLSSSIS